MLKYENHPIEQIIERKEKCKFELEKHKEILETTKSELKKASKSYNALAKSNCFTKKELESIKDKKLKSFQNKMKLINIVIKIYQYEIKQLNLLIRKNQFTSLKQLEKNYQNNLHSQDINLEYDYETQEDILDNEQEAKKSLKYL